MLQPITTKKLKHPISRCVSSFAAIEKDDAQPSQSIGWTLREIYAQCVDGLNGIDDRITTIHDGGDDFADNLRLLALDAPDEFCKLVLWLGKYLFDGDSNVAYNAQLMLEIIVDEKVMSKLREQWYRYFDHKERECQRLCAKYPLTVDGILRGIKDGNAGHQFKDWFPLASFVPDSIKKEIEESKKRPLDDSADDLPF